MELGQVGRIFGQNRSNQLNSYIEFILFNTHIHTHIHTYTYIYKYTIAIKGICTKSVKKKKKKKGKMAKKENSKFTARFSPTSS